jgi:hypothetical protein
VDIINKTLVVFQFGRNQSLMDFEDRTTADRYIEWCKENLPTAIVLAIYEKVK